MVVSDFIEWLKTQDQDATVEVSVVTSHWSHGEWYDSSYIDTFNPESNGHYTYREKAKTIQFGGQD